MLEIRNLHAGYAGKQILHGICMNAKPGQITAILGPNGCGKSTLLKTICGILPATAGTISCEGEDLLSLPRRQLAQKVACLNQTRQIPDISVRRLVLHGRYPYLSYPRRYRQADYSDADAAMSRMGIAELADTPVNQLSGGQQQKVFIAMALAQDTPVILLDEPTTYLDIAHQLHILQQARSLAQQGKTVIMIIHDLASALQTADHILLMEDGYIVAEGTPENIFQSGKLEAVFGVSVHRIATDQGPKYFCTEK